MHLPFSPGTRPSRAGASLSQPDAARPPSCFLAHPVFGPSSASFVEVLPQAELPTLAITIHPDRHPDHLLDYIPPFPTTFVWFPSRMSAVPPPRGSPPVQKSTEVRRPRTNQRLTVSFDDSDELDAAGRAARLQYEVAVETRTVTTTTTTKRAYPPLFIRQPRALEALDTKEYPLAHGPTPPDLRKFTLNLNENDDDFAAFPPHEPSFVSPSPPSLLLDVCLGVMQC